VCNNDVYPMSVHMGVHVSHEDWFTRQGKLTCLGGTLVVSNYHVSGSDSAMYQVVIRPRGDVVW
jgi:hypothetical protein